MAKYKNNHIKDITNIMKALGNVNRERIIMSLFGRELCVCQIIELLGLAPSTVSKHLYILEQVNLIESDKKGRWVYYKLAEADKNKTVQQALRWLQKSLVRDIRISKDKKLLEKILKEDPERLCLRIKKR
jgi:DNA-binding transcriptional ArsR family regulator